MNNAQAEGCVGLKAEASARRLRHKWTLVTPAHPEPSDYKSFTTNVDHVQPTKLASAGHMFSKLQLKQLTNVIAAGINTVPISVRTTDSGLTFNDPPQVIKFVILLRLLKGLIMLAILVPKYTAISLSCAIMCPTISRFFKWAVR